MARQRTRRVATTKTVVVVAPALCSLMLVACVRTGHASSAATATATMPAHETTTSSVRQRSVYSPPIFPRSLFSEAEVASWPLNPGSHKYVADIVADYKANFGTVGVDMMPILRVGPAQPKVALAPSAGCNNFLPDTSARLPAPIDPPLNGSTDNPLVVYQPSSGLDWELWQVRVLPTGSYEACWGGRLRVGHSTGVFPVPYGLAASGISYLATAVTQADVASGSIRHTLALEIPGCDGFVFPADRSDCGQNAGQPPEGTWFRLPAALQMPAGLAPFARMVFSALKHYGAIVTDQAGAVVLQAEQDSDWYTEGHSGLSPMEQSWAGEPEYSVVADIPWQDLQVVVPPRASSEPLRPGI